MNRLSLEPRPKHVKFDHDGPGYLATGGPRHDNDHVHIKNIQILPTTDEILAVKRPPFLPKKNLAEQHHMGHGPNRHFDVLFRHLRYDSTEGLRDICYTAAQVMDCHYPTLAYEREFRRETISGRRYYLYRRVKIENIFADERKGLLVQLSYDCPEFLRREKISKSGRFEEGMLCALISLKADNTICFIFLEVHLRQSTFAMDSNGGNGMRAAVQFSFANKEKPEDLLHIIRHVQEPGLEDFALVEFPSALYAGFQWHLKRLQELQGSDVAFSGTIAPRPASKSKLPSDYAMNLTRRTPVPSILPPAYTSHDHYEVDLKPIIERDVRLPIQAFEKDSRDGTLQLLKDCSTLDDGQAVALCDTLTREIAFTQGPPGTGKTFLGIAIAKTILASRTVSHFKPILVVCLTNHALDSFLKGLVDAGVERIARLGGSSREEWTKRYLLKTLSNKTKADEKDYAEKRAADHHRKGESGPDQLLSKHLFCYLVGSPFFG